LGGFPHVPVLALSSHNHPFEGLAYLSLMVLENRAKWYQKRALENKKIYGHMIHHASVLDVRL
jgi:hypothetical protein